MQRQRGSGVRLAASGCHLVLLSSLGCGNATDGTALTRAGTERAGAADESSEPEGDSNVAAPEGAPGEDDRPLPRDGFIPPAPGRIQSEAELAAELERQCGACHAGAGDGSAAALGSLQGLIDAGLVLPGSGETSPLVLRFLYGDSRSDHAGLLDPAGSGLADLITFINGMPQLGCPAPTASRDQLVAAMRRDIEARPVESRPFIRYVGIQATEPGVCGSRERQIGAFLELLNGVSLGPAVVVPGAVAVDAEAVAPLYALDIRDYGWNRAIDADDDGQTDFADGWALIAGGAGPYALELSGPDADVVKAEARVAAPYLPSHAFIGAAAASETYYSLVGVRSNVWSTPLGLGGLDGAPHRAGLFGLPKLPDRVVTRREQASRPGRSWWTREELDAADGGERPRLIDDPLGYTVGGTEVIFTLPNGLWAFAVADSGGARVSQLPNCVVECPLPLRGINSVTCRGCHAGGLADVSDDMLGYVLASPVGYDDSTRAQILAEYRPDLHASLERDQQRYRETRLAALGEAPAEDRIGRVYNEFWSRPLDAAAAAAELGISVEALRTGIENNAAALRELAPLLAGGVVGRDRILADFVTLACSSGGASHLPTSCP